MGIFDKLLNKKETQSVPASRVHPAPPTPPGNIKKKKTREEHKQECDELIKESEKAASLYLAEQIIRREAGKIIDLGHTNAMHIVSADQVISEGEREYLAKKVGEIILQKKRLDPELTRILIEIIERGENSPKELGKKILERNGLGDEILEELGAKRDEERKNLIAEEERLVKEKWEENK